MTTMSAEHLRSLTTYIEVLDSQIADGIEEPRDHTKGVGPFDGAPHVRIRWQDNNSRYVAVFG